MSHDKPRWHPRTIAVDLTPVLPGGENGGARIFVLELIRRLSELAPSTRFVLLTQAASHDGLAELDRSNVERRLVVGDLVGNGLRPRLLALAGRLLPRLPAWLRSLLSRLGYGLNRLLKRVGTGGLLGDLGAELLFCPFTAPTYWEPGVPVVSVLYDLQYRAYPEFFAAEDVANREATFRDACRRATLLVAISEYARASTIAAADLDPARVLTIPLRLARRLVVEPCSRAGVFDRFGLEAEGYLLYPANFWPHKNHVRLFEAFAMAREMGLPNDLKLVCTGAPGARLDAIQESVVGFGVADRVCFPGYVSDEALAELMSRATGLIFPSLYEGFGLPVIEAMSFGVPVACSDRTALPEVVGDAALLFDPTEPSAIARSILVLTLDHERRASLVEAGYVRARAYADTRRMADAYWKVFCEALSFDDASGR